MDSEANFQPNPDTTPASSPEYTKLNPVNKLLPSEVISLEPFLDGKEPGKKPTYNFVNQIHSGKENAEKAFTFAQDADVICYEWVGPSREKELLSTYLNMNAQGVLDEKNRAALLRFFQGGDSDEPHYLMTKFVNEFKDSGKTFVLIDASEEDPKLEHLQKNLDEAESRLIETIYSDAINIYYLQALALQDSQAGAAFLEYRDDVVKAQLSEVDRYVDGHNVKVGVFEGLVHTKPYHELHKQSKSVTRNFVPTDRPRFNVQDQIVRQIELTDKEPKPELLNRQLLSTYISAGRFADEDFHNAVNQDRGFLAKQLDTLNDEQVFEGVQDAIAFIKDEATLSTEELAQKTSDMLINKFEIQTSMAA
jgi:hypothetical protein